MKRKLIVACLTLGAIGLGAVPATGRQRAALQVHHTRMGNILVDRNGYTLYAFTPDKRNKDVCVNISNCLGAWPAVLAQGPLAGPGVRASLIGKIHVRGVGTQLTYAGHPLYGYVGDTYPGETSNINIFQFKGYWPAVSPTGKEIK